VIVFFLRCHKAGFILLVANEGIVAGEFFRQGSDQVFELGSLAAEKSFRAPDEIIR